MTWDEFLHEFGVKAYAEARYFDVPPVATRKDNDMEFTVEFSGTQSVELDEYILERAAGDAFHDAVSDFGGDISINGVSGPVEVEVSFSGTLTVELDTSDVETLVEQRAEVELSNAGLEDVTVDSVDEA